MCTIYRVAFNYGPTLIRGFVIFTYLTNKNCRIFKYHKTSNLSGTVIKSYPVSIAPTTLILKKVPYYQYAIVTLKNTKKNQKYLKKY